MMRSVVLCLLILGCVASSWALKITPTALDEYVEKFDPNYKWDIIDHVYEWPNATGYVLNMTSQQWLTPEDSDRSIWWHVMVIVIPHKIIVPDAAMLWITGGSNNNNNLPDQYGKDLYVCADLVNRTGIVVVSLHHIPNEPITFPADPKKQSRSEDAIIAYTWAHFVNYTNEPEWLLRLPMTKACVAAMNATEQYLRLHHQQDVSRWLAAGGSKRGWTTWTLGAVDYGRRLVGIMPIVMDALHFVPNMHHMYQNLGGWTFAFSDYYEEGLTAEIDSPEVAQLAGIVDAYSYLDRFVNLPKFVINAGDDEFFLNDDNWYWWDQMPGEKHLLMVQNAEHSLGNALPEVLVAVGGFASNVLHQVARPEFNWTMDLSNGTIFVKETTNMRAKHAQMWSAPTLSKKRRDWRWVIASEDGKCPLPLIPIPDHSDVCAQPIVWKSTQLQPIADGVYEATRPIPTNGHWEAFFVQLKYESEFGSDYIFTTQVAIVPNTYPFPDCHGIGCKGTLV